MRLLYHLWLSPFSRKVRIALAEKKLTFNLKAENVWERRREFLALNPMGTVPVLVEGDGSAYVGSQVICEFLDEQVSEPKLIGRDPQERAEVRRLTAWFDEKFHREVGRNLINEKITKRFLNVGSPDSKALRAGLANIHHHLDYIAYLMERRNWLAGDMPTLADFTAAAHLSVIDYLGDVPWGDHAAAKEWYQRVKCRPSVQPLLTDRIPNLTPPKHYDDLDF